MAKRTTKVGDTTDVKDAQDAITEEVKDTDGDGIADLYGEMFGGKWEYDETTEVIK